MYRRDDEKLQCRDGDQANHFRASQGAELEGFPALYRGGFVSPLIRDLESRRDVLTGQSTGWALVNTASRRSLRLFNSRVIYMRQYPQIYGVYGGTGVRVFFGALVPWWWCVRCVSSYFFPSHCSILPCTPSFAPSISCSARRQGRAHSSSGFSHLRRSGGHNVTTSFSSRSPRFHRNSPEISG